MIEPLPYTRVDAVNSVGVHFLPTYFADGQRLNNFRAMRISLILVRGYFNPSCIHDSSFHVSPIYIKHYGYEADAN